MVEGDTDTITRDDTTTGLDVIEGIDLDATIPCETTYTDDHCPNPADLAIGSHITRKFFLCTECWVDEASLTSFCRSTGNIETRDEHYWILEVLR